MIDRTIAKAEGKGSSRGLDETFESIVLEVEGMTCASCVVRVERALAAVPGASGVGRSAPTRMPAFGEPAEALGAA